MQTAASRARTALDARLAALRPPSRFQPPERGWARAIRNALGMTIAQLARRLSIAPQSVLDLEKSEAAGTISLNTLRKAAAAMDCALVYALVPRIDLEDMVRKRAREIATHELRGVAHSMALEDQASPEEFDARIERFIRDTLKERDLWDDA